MPNLGHVDSSECREIKRLAALKRWAKYREEFNEQAYLEKSTPRFWNKITKGGPNECWESCTWQMWWHSKLTYVSRISWFIHYGVWPELNVLHRCDNKVCVNPSHLFLGTQADNMKDMWDKGRARPFGQPKTTLRPPALETTASPEVREMKRRASMIRWRKEKAWLAAYRSGERDYLSWLKNYVDTPPVKEEKIVPNFVRCVRRSVV